jgi:hypothetical protein
LNIEEAIRAQVAEGAAEDGKSYKILRAGSSRSHGHAEIRFTIDALYAVYDFHIFAGAQNHLWFPGIYGISDLWINGQLF